MVMVMVCLSVCLSVSVSLSLFLCLSVCLSVCTGVRASHVEFCCCCALSHEQYFISSLTGVKYILPHVTTKSARVLAYEGQNVTLTCEEWNLCEEIGDEIPLIIWYYNQTKKIGYQDGEISKKQCRDIGKLLVRLKRQNVSSKDQGTYRCFVKNNNGKDEKEIELDIFPSGKILYFLEEPKYI